MRNATLWANLGFEAGQWKAWVAAQGGYDSFWRFGNVQKGLFPDTSYGKSDVSSFFTYRFKGGVSWNRGPHRVWANAGYFTEAPLFTESFISPRTRNTLASNLQTQKTVSADLSYAFNKNNYSLRITGYYTYIADQTDLMSFYDDSQNSFTNFAMSGIDERHCGIELGFQVPLPLTGLSLQGEVSVDGAEIHRQVAKLFGKALPGNHCQRKTAGEGFPEDGFVQLGVVSFGHARSPFRK